MYTHEKLGILSIEWHIASQKIPILTIAKVRLKSAINYGEGFINKYFESNRGKVLQLWKFWLL